LAYEPVSFGPALAISLGARGKVACSWRVLKRPSQVSPPAGGFFSFEDTFDWVCDEFLIPDRCAVQNVTQGRDGGAP
jgi:hypothetical protein